MASRVQKDKVVENLAAMFKRKGAYVTTPANYKLLSSEPEFVHLTHIKRIWGHYSTAVKAVQNKYPKLLEAPKKVAPKKVTPKPKAAAKPAVKPAVKKGK